MEFGAVTFMLAETILGKLRAKVTHHPITGYLSDHAGRRDAQAYAIAIHNSGLGQGKRDHRQAIDQNVIRPKA
jgi:hypothetical protein